MTMHFSVNAKEDPRFDGDFRIEAVDGYAALPLERNVLDAVNEAIEQLAADEKREAAGGYSADLLKGRRSSCTSAAAELRRTADGFASGQFDAQAAMVMVAAAQKIYREKLPKFGTADATEPRFGGDFQVIDGLTENERLFVTRLRWVLDNLASDEKSDLDEKFTAGVLAARRQLRNDTASKLRSAAKEVAERKLDADIAADNMPVMWGEYRALRDRLTQTLFDVSIYKKTIGGKEYNAAIDLEVTSGLPPPNDTVAPDKQELFNEINSVFTVIRIVSTRLGNGSGSWFERAPDEATKRRALDLHDEYVGKLAGVAGIGLKDNHIAFAKLALAAIKNEFLAREAGRIKNTYVLRLGVWAGIAALIFFVGWWLVTAYDDKPGWWYVHRSFLLAGAGAAIGTWLSFSVRRVQLSFDQLMMLEEWSLDPPLRVIFVVALTMVACLLFWTNLVNIEIGNLKTNAMIFQSNGAVALLIGVFAGLSERALSTAISGRAVTFVQGLGGST